MRGGGGGGGGQSSPLGFPGGRPLKVAFVGPRGAGKTSLIRRLTRAGFPEAYRPTPGVETTHVDAALGGDGAAPLALEVRRGRVGVGDGTLEPWNLGTLAP
mmetsp:Transcript_33053/g.104579  ORF Transcript_33053/g.104579 Transcript_33053/m.104579 type:complete len:101 (-) Transcript_33053:498-800(-)